MLTLLRRPVGRSKLFLSRLRRLQHGGPHKEYFQNPSQFPTVAAPQYFVPPQPEFPAEPSLLRRLVRAVLWAGVFGAAGAAAGTSAITWEYLQPPFEVGSEEDLEMFEDIADMVDAHPLLTFLSQTPGWSDQAMHFGDLELQKDRDLHLLSRKTLKGCNGISMVGFLQIMQLTLVGLGSTDG